jgi:hypothetical protein
MEPGYSYIPTTGLKRTKRKVCPKITHQMLNTRMPLMDVIAVAGTFVLKIFFVLRSREKHKNTSQSFARMGNINIIITDLKCFVLYLMPLHITDVPSTDFWQKWIPLGHLHFKNLGGPNLMVSSRGWSAVELVV